MSARDRLLMVVAAQFVLLIAVIVFAQVWG